MLLRLSRVVLLLLLLTCFSTTAWAAPTASQRRELVALRSAMRKAGSLFKKRKYKESGVIVRDVRDRINKLSAGSKKDKELARQIKPIRDAVNKAGKLLQQEGVMLSPKKRPVGKKPAAPPIKLPPAGPVSFVKHMAPILISKCGRCHVNAERGKLSMASYDALMKGTPDGVIVFKGDADGSRLVEVIESGDMPRGGLKILPGELATIKKWIKAGAKNDGKSGETNLATLAPNARPARAPRVTVGKATGKETVSFSRDIAPVLSENCANCHGRGRRPRARLNLNTFAGLIRGGENGPPVLPGRAGESLLIKKLKGTGGGQRMPFQLPALSDQIIAKFETWISEGATFDGPDKNQAVGQVAELASAKAATHEQLSQSRQKIAMANWELSMSGIDADVIETENFLLVGNVGKEKLQGHADLAESLVSKVGGLFSAPSGRPLIKGRLTLFVFKQRYDYSEFGNMIEKRQLPRAWKGHWRYNIIDAYATVLPSRTDKYTVDALLAQNMAGVYVASLPGVPPRWFSEALARVAAEKVASSDSRVQSWNKQFSEIVARQEKKDDFLTGKLPPEEADIVGYAFAKRLMTDKSRYNRLLAALQKGDPFAQAFKEIYGGTPSELANKLLSGKSTGKTPRKTRRRKR